MRIEYKHNLSKEEAHKRISNLLTNLQREHADKIRNPQIKWDSTNTHMEYSIELMQNHLTGTVYLQEYLVMLEGTVPAKYAFFSSMIKNMIRKELAKSLS